MVTEGQEGHQDHVGGPPTGKVLVKGCHKELAEHYKERLLAEGLSVSIEPAG
jgi:hypothetical protein